MSLGSLPSELYSFILDHLDGDAIQPTTLALSRAIPYAPIPLERFFQRVRLSAPERVVQLQRRLRGGKVEANYVRELSIESWTADAQVILNLLALLENLTSLALFVGPNFAPENLLEAFERPRERLETLSLRFRPYVQRANYYHFLKGAYFDPTISAIAKWPFSSLRSLSIVQDPLIQLEQSSFAQPLVFFTFQPLLTLALSAAAQHITALRIRVPARDVAPYLAVAPQAFPALRSLDLSTGNIKGAQLSRLLARFDCVQHVRLDACALLAGREPEEWAALGKDCALTGVRRAHDRERALKAWQAAQLKILEPAQTAEQAAATAAYRSKGRGGRKGLATATISLRGAAEPTLPPPTSVHTAGTSGPSPPIDPSILQRKIRVAPLPPSLLSLTATAPPPLPSIEIAVDLAEHLNAFREGFAEGWEAGINQLRSTWIRLRTSARHNVHVMALAAGAEPEATGGGLDGLEELDEEGWNALEDGHYPAPNLCLAGESVDGTYGELHVDGCGHRVTETMWGGASFLRRP